jgi:tRNA (guanine-N7-)-methyltransferase
MRTNTRTFPPAEIVPKDDREPLDLLAIFERDAPLEVDLGCGDGAFLVALARERPERNFVGVERLVGRVRGTARKIGDGQVPNARILHADIQHAIQHLLPPASVDVFYLMFPDPWPKRRHHVRRTFNASFLVAIRRALKAGGVLHVATDDADYFSAMQQLLVDTRDLVARDGDARALPMSTFETRFRTCNLAIQRLALRKL